MSPHHVTNGAGRRETGRRLGRTALAALLVSVGATGSLAGAVSVAGAAGNGSVTGSSSPGVSSSGLVLSDPTGNHHHYRHGAVPRIVSSTRLRAASSKITSMAITSKTLTYGGGLTAGGLVKAGVTTGQPKVYLVFYGSQWGTETTTGSGAAAFSQDPNALAPALQAFYGGLGTDGEQWSGIVTQYCDGVAVGAPTCNSSSANILYPAGGVLAGVWYDNSGGATAGATAGATGHQLAAESEAAATHFGNTDQASNRDAQYVIASPTGSNPDGWANPSNGYCAYHDDTHDSFIDGGGAVGGPILAFTNMPYVPDAGSSCGAGSVNNPGTLDGATEAASHEYGETLTDQFPENNPPGGWSNSLGAEIGDRCAYIPAPIAGAAYNLTLATGTVAVQGLWSNAANSGKGGCVQSAPVDRFPPTVTSFTPAAAPAGATVSITGVNLSGATAVTFHGTPATVVSDTGAAVVAVVPAGATKGPLSVQTPGGTASSTKSFTPQPTVVSFSPASGPVGTTVAISGSGLASAKKVTVNGKKATIVLDSAAHLVIIVPAKASSGLLMVQAVGGKAFSVSPFTVT